MKIIIEGKPVVFDVRGKEILYRVVVAEVEEFLLRLGKIPVGLKINGESLTQEGLEESLDKIINTNDEMEFTVEEITAHLANQLDGCLTSNENLVNLIESLTTDAETDIGADQWREVANQLNDFFQYWHKLNRLVGYHLEGVTVKKRNLDSILKQVLAICQETVVALENKDLVLVVDLLRYEMIPLIRIVDEFIPKLKAVLLSQGKYEVENEVSTQV